MFSISKVRLQELTKIFLECQPNCEDCDNLIFQLSEHIRATHVISEDQDQSTFDTSDFNELYAPEEDVAVTRTSSRLRVKKSKNYNEKYLSNPPQVQSQPVKKAKVKVEIMPSVTDTDRRRACTPCSVYENNYLTQDDEIEQSFDNDDLDLEYKYDVDSVSAENEEQRTDFKTVVNPVVTVQEGLEFTSVKPKPKRIRIRYPKHHGKLKLGMGRKSKGPHICSVCRVEFEKGMALINHFKEEHKDAGLRAYGCPLCDKTFKNCNTFGQHKKTVHLKRAKSFVCEFCEKAFEIKYRLDVHLRSHTGERPYLCGVCGKGFAHKKIYDYHMRVHLGVRPFKCDHCSKSFVRKDKLTVHLRTHTGEKPHMCDLCGKSYKVRELLTIHKRSHTGEKPFMCEQCSKCFTTQRSLNNHIKSHDGVKEFSCEHCGKAFTLKSQLHIHSKTHQAQTSRVSVDTEGSYPHNHNIILESIPISDSGLDNVLFGLL